MLYLCQVVKCESHIWYLIINIIYFLHYYQNFNSLNSIIILLIICVPGILDTVLRKMPHLITNQDITGMTPLSHAASIGFLDGVQCLLEKASDCGYKMDLNGFFPIHTASKKGHIEVIEFFLKQYPDMSELLNQNGQNILHVAAVSGKAKAAAYMLKRDNLEMLINEKDNHGNTPLHLASKERHPKVVSILTWDKRVSLKSLNNLGKTALDVAGDYSTVEFPSFREVCDPYSLYNCKSCDP